MTIPDALLHSARGFACVLWGIPVGLILFLRGLEFSVVQPVRLSGHLLGILVIYLGILHLQKASSLTGAWNRLTGYMSFSLVSQVCLSPFLMWWRSNPQSLYLTVNTLALLAVTVWGLVIVTRLAEETAVRLRDQAFQAECVLARALTIVLMLVPAVHIVLRSATSVMQAGGFDPVRLPMPAFSFYLPLWARVITLVPFTLAMAAAWKAKERCLAALTISARQSTRS